MDNSKDFDTILDECLERVFGGESLEVCLAAYPEHAEELRPLLETVVETKDAADVAPRPEFRQEAARQFQQAVQNLPVRKPVGSFSFRHWWVSVTAVLAVIIFGSAGTVFAANTAQPDNFLYPVKLVTENVRISLASSDQAKAELYAEFADRRVSEIVTMATKGNAAAVEKATNHLDGQLVAMAGVVDFGENAELATMASATKGDQGVLTAPMPTVPTDATAPSNTPNPAGSEPVTGANNTPMMNVVPDRTAGGGADNVTGAGQGAPPEAAATVPASEGSSFKNDVSNQAAEAVQKLQDAIQNSPDAAHGGLQHALDVVKGGYGKVLDELK